MKICYCHECDEYYPLDDVKKIDPEDPKDTRRNYQCPREHITDQPVLYEVLVLHKLDNLTQAVEMMVPEE